MADQTLVDAMRKKAEDLHSAHGCNLISTLLSFGADRIEKLEREAGAKQAEIDRLMLEFCPEEMTPEQIGNWAKHQKPVEDHHG
jgi:hypothetical protein